MHMCTQGHADTRNSVSTEPLLQLLLLQRRWWSTERMLVAWRSAKCCLPHKVFGSGHLEECQECSREWYLSSFCRFTFCLMLHLLLQLWVMSSSSPSMLVSATPMAPTAGTAAARAVGARVSSNRASQGPAKLVRFLPPPLPLLRPSSALVCASNSNSSTSSLVNCRWTDVVTGNRTEPDSCFILSFEDRLV